MHHASALFQTLECLLKYISTYSHNIQMHCRALKYYFVAFYRILITQGNKPSASLFDFIYSFVLNISRSLLIFKHLIKKNGPAYKCWIVLYLI